MSYLTRRPTALLLALGLSVGLLIGLASWLDILERGNFSRILWYIGANKLSARFVCPWNTNDRGDIFRSPDFAPFTLDDEGNIYVLDISSGSLVVYSYVGRQVSSRPIHFQLSSSDSNGGHAERSEPIGIREYYPSHFLLYKEKFWLSFYKPLGDPSELFSRSAGGDPTLQAYAKDSGKLVVNLTSRQLGGQVSSFAQAGDSCLILLMAEEGKIVSYDLDAKKIRRTGRFPAISTFYPIEESAVYDWRTGEYYSAAGLAIDGARILILDAAKLLLYELDLDLTIRRTVVLEKIISNMLNEPSFSGPTFSFLDLSPAITVSEMGDILIPIKSLLRGGRLFDRYGFLLLVLDKDLRGKGIFWIRPNGNATREVQAVQAGKEGVFWIRLKMNGFPLRWLHDVHVWRGHLFLSGEDGVYKVTLPRNYSSSE